MSQNFLTLNSRKCFKVFMGYLGFIRNIQEKWVNRWKAAKWWSIYEYILERYFVIYYFVCVWKFQNTRPHKHTHTNLHAHTQTHCFLESPYTDWLGDWVKGRSPTSELCSSTKYYLLQKVRGKEITYTIQDRFLHRFC